MGGSESTPKKPLKFNSIYSNKCRTDKDTDNIYFQYSRVGGLAFFKIECSMFNNGDSNMFIVKCHNKIREKGHIYTDDMELLQKIVNGIEKCDYDEKRAPTKNDGVYQTITVNNKTYNLDKIKNISIELADNINKFREKFGLI